LGISGSIRRQSVNTIVLATLRDRMTNSHRVSLTLYGLQELPLYNEDLEADGFPPPVAAFHTALRASDGLVLCSPEYNHGISGVLKNALDWASRPTIDSPLKGMPALVMTAAPSPVGGARATHQMRDALAACLARVVSRRDVVIARVYEKIANGKLIDAEAIDFALQAIDDLIAEIRLLRLTLKRNKNATG
jgi:chromate reductase